MNNNVFNIDHTFNEAIYDFISAQSNLISQSSLAESEQSIVVDLKVAQRIIRHEIVDAIVFDQMFVKSDYDRKHQSLYMRIDD